MVKTIKEKGIELYQCEACGFKYTNEETAQKCEEWCNKYHSCNLDIVKDAIEA